MRKVLTLLSVASATVLASCAAGPQLNVTMREVRSAPVIASMGSQQLLDQGKNYLRLKQYGLAIEMLRGAARDPALTAEAYNGLGIAYDGIGRGDLAERYFERAIAAAPNDERFQANLGRYYAASNQPEKQQRLLADMETTRQRNALVAAASAPATDAAVPNVLAGAAAADVALAAPGDGPVTATPASMSVALRIAPESPLADALAPVIADVTQSDFAAIEFGGARCTIGNATDAAGPCLWQANDALTAGSLSPNERMMVRTSLGEVFLVTGDPVAAYGLARTDPVVPKPSVSARNMLGMVAAMLDFQNKAAVAVAAKAPAPGRPRTIRITLVGKGPPS